MIINTPYDDVFKTLVVDCKELLPALINEIFHETYVGNETIRFYPNEHYLQRENGNASERITDTCFEIIGTTKKKYHLECQSTVDSHMLIRMFEYDSQIALDDSNVDSHILKVNFPNSAILYLRSNSNTPDTMQIQILTPIGSITYPIPVIKMKNYTSEELFEKKLYFLIPFYIFVYENQFSLYNKNINSLKLLLQEYENIKNQLEALCLNGEISELTKCTIFDMVNKTLQHLANKHENLRKGVSSVMGGKVLEYEAKTIFRNGIAQGIPIGKTETLVELVRDGLLPAAEAAKRSGKSIEEFQVLLDNFINK